MNFPMWTYDVVRAVHFYEAILATLTIIVWHFYSVVFNPDVYPMNWAWITGEMTEHEMEEEHGLELEKLKAEEKAGLTEMGKAAAAGSGLVYSIHDKGKGKGSSIRRIYDTARDLNKNMKDWKGV